MFHNIMNNENIMNATANVTATASDVGFTAAQADVIALGAGAMLLFGIAMMMD